MASAARPSPGYPRIFAVGDCNYSCVDEPGKKPDEWPIPPIPKISYPGEEMLLGYGWKLAAKAQDVRDRLETSPTGAGLKV